MSLNIDDPKVRDGVKDALKEYANTQGEIESLKNHAKEILTAAADLSGIEKKTLNKIARFYHRQNLAENETAFAEIRELYKKLIG